MIYTYAIDDKLFDIPESNVELWLEKVDRVLSTISRRALWVDCSEEGIYNQLAKKIHSLTKSTHDDILAKSLEELWKNYFWNHQHSISDSCLCEDTSKCNTGKNINALNNKFADIPALIIQKNNQLEITGFDYISVDNYKESNVYKSCSKNTFVDGGPVKDKESGIKVICNNWGGLIKLSKMITILDRNVFERWNENYQNGLIQFAEAISLLNPSAKLRIISRYRKRHRDKDLNDFQVRDSIREILKSIIKPSIEIILCRNEALFDKDRFIYFDEKISAVLNRGLDTFVPNSQKDHYRITYLYFEEIEPIIKAAIQYQINKGDFKSITN